jgi:hypothetical protein
MIKKLALNDIVLVKIDDFDYDGVIKFNDGGVCAFAFAGVVFKVANSNCLVAKLRKSPSGIELLLNCGNTSEFRTAKLSEVENCALAFSQSDLFDNNYDKWPYFHSFFTTGQRLTQTRYKNQIPNNLMDQFEEVKADLKAVKAEKAIRDQEKKSLSSELKRLTSQIEQLEIDKSKWERNTDGKKKEVEALKKVVAQNEEELDMQRKEIAKLSMKRKAREEPESVDEKKPKRQRVENNPNSIFELTSDTLERLGATGQTMSFQLGSNVGLGSKQ